MCQHYQDRKCLSGSDECWNKSTGKFQTASVIMGSWLLSQVTLLVPLTCEQVPETLQPSLWMEVQWWGSPTDSGYISSVHTRLDCEHSSGLVFPENQYQLVVFIITASCFTTFLKKIVELTFITPPSFTSLMASCSWASLATIFFSTFFKLFPIFPSTRAVAAINTCYISYITKCQVWFVWQNSSSHCWPLSARNGTSLISLNSRNQKYLFSLLTTY